MGFETIRSERRGSATVTTLDQPQALNAISPQPSEELSGGKRPMTARGGFAGLGQRTLAQPVIAAINGLAYGGGAEITLACDTIVASETAAFASLEVKRGLAPGQAPIKIGMEAALTSETLSAREAECCGLVNRVMEPERLLEAALEPAEAIARNAPPAVQASKAIICEAPGAPLTAVLTAWDATFVPTRGVSESEDAKERPRAFAEKRQPVWKGR
jgi:enoyl-CoA hydratase/carnithine racemase